MPYDPFSDMEDEVTEAVIVEETPEESPWEETVPEPPKKENPKVTVVPTEGKLTVTLKGGASFDAPWIVVHADDATEALAQLEDPQMVELIKKATVMANGFQKTYGGAKPAAPVNRHAPANSDARKPPEATAAPNGQKKFCQHGEMEFKSGISKKTGKAYSLFSCTGPREDQCDAQWPDK